MSGIGSRIYRSYFANRAARWLFDSLGITHAFFGSPYFRLPDPAALSAFGAALVPLPAPRVLSDTPVLIEVWRQVDGRSEVDAGTQSGAGSEAGTGSKAGARLQVHLVNYGDAPCEPLVEFPAPVQATALSPDRDGEQHLHGQRLAVPLDIYTVLLV
jgi:hypothetical protein